MAPRENHPVGTAAPALWVQSVPRIYLDAWATLLRWHECGERVSLITAEQEEAALAAPLAPDLPLASAALP